MPLLDFVTNFKLRPYVAVRMNECAHTRLNIRLAYEIKKVIVAVVVVIVVDYYYYYYCDYYYIYSQLFTC